MTRILKSQPPYSSTPSVVGTNDKRRMMGKPFWLNLFCGKVRRVYFLEVGMVEEGVCEGIERNRREGDESRGILVQQVNKCTILSPDMSIQELARRLTSVGLSLSDVRVKPLVRPDRVKATDPAFIEALDATKERWKREMLAAGRYTVWG